MGLYLSMHFPPKNFSEIGYTYHNIYTFSWKATTRNDKWKSGKGT